MVNIFGSTVFLLVESICFDDQLVVRKTKAMSHYPKLDLSARRSYLIKSIYTVLIFNSVAISYLTLLKL